MIKNTTMLSEADWENLNGNDLFVSMLRNKVILYMTKEETADSDVFDYIKEVPEFLVYYKAENVFGSTNLSVYFEGVTDMENFIHFYNTDKGIKRIKN
ncbi:hypothetical protein N9N08_00380 [bacterium]|jgi:hypothetical protein|nr:hypothetical protein [bacterium]|tara:strand:+ start:233 stop:526 length:294 start_codon:yes stop_codon:yes gene_type:complete